MALPSGRVGVNRKCVDSNGNILQSGSDGGLYNHALSYYVNNGVNGYVSLVSTNAEPMNTESLGLWLYNHGYDVNSAVADRKVYPIKRLAGNTLQNDLGICGSSNGGVMLYSTNHSTTTDLSTVSFNDYVTEL